MRITLPSARAGATAPRGWLRKPIHRISLSASWSSSHLDFSSESSRPRHAAATALAAGVSRKKRTPVLNAAWPCTLPAAKAHRLTPCAALLAGGARSSSADGERQSVAVITSASHSVRRCGSGSASQMTSTSERSTCRLALSTLSTSSPLSAPICRNSVTLERRSASVVRAKSKYGSRYESSSACSFLSSAASTSCFSLRSMYTWAAQLYASCLNARLANDIHTMPPSGTSSKSAGSVRSRSYHWASRTTLDGSAAKPAHAHSPVLPPPPPPPPGSDAAALLPCGSVGAAAGRSATAAAGSCWAAAAAGLTSRGDLAMTSAGLCRRR